MILPNLKLLSLANQRYKFFGMDSPDQCLDRKHFKNYPDRIDYEFNSRGFRDSEWPENLTNSLWCLGDSFTVGLGQPYDQIWPQVLQSKLGINTINISLNGASNNWIARKALDVLTQVAPDTIVIHWSFLHRREQTIEEAQKIKWQSFYNAVKDASWPDATLDHYDSLPQRIRDELADNHKSDWQIVNDIDRCLHGSVDQTPEQNISNTLSGISMIENAKNHTTVIHSFITDFSFMLDSNNSARFLQQINSLNLLCIPEFPKFDYARDKFHYGIKTTDAFTEQIIDCL